MSEPKQNIRVKVRAAKDTENGNYIGPVFGEEDEEEDDWENDERNNPHSNMDENGNYIGPVFYEGDEEEDDWYGPSAWSSDSDEKENHTNFIRKRASKDTQEPEPSQGECDPHSKLVNDSKVG